jgi:alpha-L-fucosidase
MANTAYMQGEELASMEKSNEAFNDVNAVKSSDLKLSAEDMKWWRDAKFGMFIHWGLYAIPATGEWTMHNQGIPAEGYAKLADEFVPKHFDADAWALAARDAGMRYMVLTARHHDGFALWDSPASYGGFCSGKTAAKRDFVAEYVDGCRNAGLRVGLYYSPMDWRFPGYFQPQGLADNAALMKRQCYGQVEELMSRYGQIDVLWYDGGWLAHKGSDADAAWFWEPLKLNGMVRRHQPKAVINPRSGWEGDFKCNEGNHAVSGPIIDGPWEKCLNLNMSSWGYNEKNNPMTPAEIVRMLVNVVGRGGNMLLNVGPDRDGVIPPSHVDILKKVGKWLQVHGNAIYGTNAGPFQPVEGRYCSTSHGKNVYIHVLDWQPDGRLLLPDRPGLLISCRSLSGERIGFREEQNSIELMRKPGKATDFPTVVELTFDGDVL